MTDEEKLVYDFCYKWKEFDMNEFNKEFGDDRKYKDALCQLCGMGRIFMAAVNKNDVPKLKWVVDKLHEKEKDNPAYYFFIQD